MATNGYRCLLCYRTRKEWTCTCSTITLPRPLHSATINDFGLWGSDSTVEVNDSIRFDWKPMAMFVLQSKQLLQVNAISPISTLAASDSILCILWVPTWDLAVDVAVWRAPDPVKWLEWVESQNRQKQWLIHKLDIYNWMLCRYFPSPDLTTPIHFTPAGWPLKHIKLA